MTQRIRLPATALSAVFSLVLAACSSAPKDIGGSSSQAEPIRTGEPKLEFDSAQLMMKNADQVNELIKQRMKKAADAQAAQAHDPDAEGITVEFETLEALKDAMRIALSRPDQDGSRAAMFMRVRRELSDLNSADIVIRDLARESVDALKSGRPAKVQATYVYILENLMAELRPDLDANPNYVKIVEMIRDADIEIDPAVRKQLMMRTMSKPGSPSDSAARILPKANDKNKR